MTETKHTPGPWTLKMGDGAGRQVLGIIGSGNQTNQGEYILKGNIPVPLFTDVWVQFGSEEWNEMQDANAKLIAAAPDLLKACINALSVGEIHFETCVLSKGVKKTLLEAIEKATI